MGQLAPRITPTKKAGPITRYTGTHVGNVRSLPGTTTIVEEEDEGVDITGLLLTAEVISEVVCDVTPTSFLDTEPSASLDSDF